MYSQYLQFDPEHNPYAPCWVVGQHGLPYGRNSFKKTYYSFKLL